MKYKVKINNQWYEVTVEVNVYSEKIPLLARIFGQKQSSEFESEDGETTTEIFSIIYRGNIYIYQEKITTRKKIRKSEELK